MADIIISIVTKVAEYLVEPSIREGKYFLCVNNVIKDLENERNELISERDNLLHLIEQAKERTEIIEKPVEKWLDDVESLVKAVEVLEQRMIANTSCFQGRFPTWRRYSLCKEMVEKIETIEKFKGKSNIQPFSHRAALPGIQYHADKNFTYFESTKVAYNQLMEALKDDCIYTIGVYGMGGCGKTTLVTKVGKMAEESNMFDKVISITMSQTPNIRNIQGKMADMLNLKLEEESEEGRAQRLWLSLKEKKKILIIIDDLWREFNLMNIGIHLDGVNKGAWKILVTTRNHNVCTSMDCQKIIHVGLLSGDESWTLFKKFANIDEEFSQSLNGVPKKLCDECKGLLIAIVTIASSLKGKQEFEWEVALDKLTNSDAFDDHDEGVKTALSCLELSYNYLQNKEAELLFLVCSVFPEDHNILIEYLIRYAIGLGVGGRSMLESKRNLIKSSIYKLINSCLLMHDEDKQCVKMHDLVRDAALWIAKRLGNRKILVNVDKPLNTLEEDNSSRDCFAASSWWYNENTVFCQLHAPILEILLIYIRHWRRGTSLDLSHLTFEGIERLKVLSLTFVSPKVVPFSLPPSIQLLTNVRTLRLNGLMLGDISLIARLTCLEILDLQHCEFNELPDDIGMHTRLKLLDLSRCRFFEKTYNGAIARCSQLEELYTLPCSPEEYAFDITMDSVTLPKLQRFVIGNDPSGTNLAKSTRSIVLRNFNISKLRNIIQKAEHVCLKNLNGGCKNIIPDIIQKDLTNLWLDECLEIECIFDRTSNAMIDDLIPQLVELHLKRMVNLTGLCQGPPLQVLCFLEKLEKLVIGSCPMLHIIFPRECKLRNLKFLRLSACPLVEVLFPISVAQSLQQLEELEITSCWKLKHLIAASERTEIVEAPLNSNFIMPSLRRIWIHGCEVLESIFSICYVEGLARLQFIQIVEAPELKYIFGECDHKHHSSHQYQNQSMIPQLEVLDLDSLNNLIGMCPEYYHAKWPSHSLLRLSVDHCPKLAMSWIAVMIHSDHSQHRLDENLVLLCGLPQLHSISWLGPTTPRQNWSLQCLQYLTVINCMNLKSLFSMEVSRSLPELTDLYISNCNELEQIVSTNEELVQLPNAEVYFPKLKHINVKECNKLKSLFPIAMVKMLPQLSNLDITSVPKLEEVFRRGGDRSVNEMEVVVVLPNLANITLEYLPSFVDICQGCKFQAEKLQELLITGCSEIAPSLKAIQEALGEASSIHND